MFYIKTIYVFFMFSAVPKRPSSQIVLFIQITPPWRGAAPSCDRAADVQHR